MESREESRQPIPWEGAGTINREATGRVLVTRAQGTTDASHGLRGRVWEVSFADLQKDEVVFRKSQLIGDGDSRNCLANFHSPDLTDRMYHVTGGGGKRS